MTPAPPPLPRPADAAPSALAPAAAPVEAAPAAARPPASAPVGGVSAAEKKRCHDLLEAVGQVLWVDDEALMDPVTALSGSGPAYVFLLVEAMATAGADDAYTHAPA